MKLNILKIILLLILFTSCKKNIGITKNNPIKIAEETCKEEIITASGYFLVTPEGTDMDSLKNTMGENFFTVADDSNYYISEINGLLKNSLQKIKANCINFENEKYIIKKKDQKLNWFIIDYKKGEKPQVFSLVDFYVKLTEKETLPKNGSVQQEIDRLNKSNTLNTYTFDINGDGREDKIFSNKPNTGDSLLVYFQTDNKFKLVLETTNFSQDGGQQFSTIKKNGRGFSIETDFPNEMNKYTYNISYYNNKFILNKVIHQLHSWQNDNNQQCHFNTNIDLKETQDKIWQNLIDSEEKANCFK